MFAVTLFSLRIWLCALMMLDSHAGIGEGLGASDDLGGRVLEARMVVVGVGPIRELCEIVEQPCPRHLAAEDVGITTIGKKEAAATSASRQEAYIVAGEQERRESLILDMNECLTFPRNLCEWDRAHLGMY